MLRDRPPPGAWSAGLPDGLFDRLTAAGHVRTLPDGAAVYRAGDPGDGLNAVVSGEVRLVGHSGQGRRLVYLIAGAGQWFGEMSMIDGLPRLHDAICQMPSRILHVAEPALRRLAQEDPRLVWSLGRLVCEHQRATLAFVERALTASADVRLAIVLLGLSADAAAGGSSIRLTRDELAAMVGLSRQGLEPVLGRFVDAGVVRTHYGRLEIVDRAALATAAAS